MMAARGMVADRAVRPGRTGKRPVAIWDALVWAFRVERASLDFDEMASVAGERPGVGMEWFLMQRHNLGCQVDGGGRSDPHPDAEVLAQAVACLPEGCGGRRMAICIADLAGRGEWPDPMVDAVPRCVPAGWHVGPHGRSARREFWTGPGRWPETQLRRSSHFADGYVCPVTYTGTARETGAARRHWLAWRGALLELRETFRIHDNLTGFAITEDLPPLAPWRKGA